MKKLVLLLSLCLIGLFSLGQNNRFPSIDSLKTYILKYYRNSTVETFTNYRGQNIAYGTAELLDSLTANLSSGAVDSVWITSSVTKDSIKYRKSGTTYTAGTLDKASLKLSISDTSAMLSPYLRSNVAAATYQPIGSYATTSQVTAVQSNLDTTRTGIRADLNGKQGALTLTTTGSSGAATLTGNTLNIPQYSGGGGGSADSSWVSSETGVAPNQLGYLVNSTLSALPSGWADVTPAASVTFSGKMIVSGGATTTASVIGNTGTGTAYANRIDMDYYPYSKLRYAFTVVPQDKTGTSNGFALHFKANAITTSFAMRIVFDLTNTADSGKISIGYDYSAAVATSANLSHNAGDTLDIEVVRDHWLIYAKIYNRRTAKQVDAKYYSYGSDFGTGGMAYLGLLGGEQHFLSAKVYSYDLKNGAAFTFLGDSQFSGSGASDEGKTFPFQVMRGNKNKIANLSAPGVTLSAIVNSHVPAAIALNNPVIVGAGFNDRSVLSTDTTTFKTRLDAVVDPLIAAGLPVWVTTLVPTNTSLATFNSNFDLAIINYCAANGIPVIRIDSILKKSGDSFNRIKENYLGADAIHWSDSGQYVSGQKVLQIIGERMPTFFKDTTSPVKFYNVPTGEQNMAMLVLDEKTSEVKKVPATTFDIIYNSYKFSGVGTTGQKNTSIHVDKTITTDSLIHVNNRIGLVLQFNGSTGLEASTTAGSNILMTNRATTLGYPHAVPNFTGTRNVIFETLSTKSGNASYTGNENFVWSTALAGTMGFSNVISLGAGNSFTLTSGSSHVHIGPQAGRGITTGSNTIVITQKNTSSQNLPATLNNAIIMGDLTSFTASTNDYQANDIAFSTSYFNDEQFWFGGRTKPEKVIYLNFPSISTVSNYQGNDGVIRAGKGSGTGRSGYITFQSWNSTTSGTTLHSTPSTEMVIENKKVRVDNRFQTSTGADVASANDLTLGSDGNVFTITGTTQINAITTTNWQAGSEIILIFSSSVTVKNNTAGGANTAVLLLAGGADFSATSNDVLKLVYNGTSWFEVSRSVN